MDVNADKILFGPNKLDSLKAILSLSEAIANLKVSGKMDSVKYARLTSEINLKGHDITLNVDSLYLKYNNYNLENYNRWNISYIPQQEVNINQLGLKSGKMVLNVDGVYSSDRVKQHKYKGR